MTGLDVLRQLAIPTPQVAMSGPKAMGRLLQGMARDLALATRGALQGGSADDLIAEIDRAEPWPPMASGVHVAAEVLAHVADCRRTQLPTRTREAADE